MFLAVVEIDVKRSLNNISKITKILGIQETSKFLRNIELQQIDQ